MREFVINCTFLFFGISIIGIAQQREFRFERISVDQGLSQSSINSIVQDKFGFLWLATFDGLNQYDGYAFKIYRRKEGDNTSLFSNQVYNVFLDESKTLWIGTNGSMSRYVPENDNFKNYPIEVDGVKFPEARPFDVFQIDNEWLMLSTSLGLFKFSTVTGKYEIPQEFRFLQKQAIYTYCHSKKIGTWVLMFDKILHRKPGVQQWIEIKSYGITSGLLVKETEELFVRTQSELYRLNSNSGQLEKIGTFPFHNSWPSPIMKLANGKLWLGAGGIWTFNKDYKFEAGIVSSKQLPYSLSGNTVSSFYETKDGVIWVGTSGYGLNKFDPQMSRFGHLASFPGASITLSNNYIDAIYTEDDNTIYVSTVDGLDVINLKDSKSQHFDYPQLGEVKARANCIFKNADHSLSIGTTSGLFEFKKNKIISVANKLFKTSAINDIVNMPSGDILYVLPEGIVVGSNSEKLMIKKEYSSVVLLDGDSLWVGTKDHASIFIYSIRSGEQLAKFEYSSDDKYGLPIGGIKCLYKDTRGTIWIGSVGGGLTMYDTPSGKFINYSEKDGLPNSVVYGILEDANNNLWLSTNKGLCEFNIETKEVRTFDVDDGLQSNEFNSHAFFKSAAGVMYFGGINGVSYFHPDNVNTQKYIPQSVITNYYINNQEIKNIGARITYDSAKINKVLTLQANERDFGFDVAGLGFSIPGRTRYKYLLENYDKQWNEIGNLRHINFTNIPSGTYVFKVKSSNSHGDWEENGASLVVVIKTPIWRNTWVISTISVVLISLIFGFYYYRLYRLRENAKRLTILVKNRTMEIQIQKEEIAAQNEEIATSNEELLAQSEVLAEKNIEIEKQNAILKAQADVLEEKNEELERVKQLLEIRVEERTRDLKRLNSDLVSQNNKLEQFSFITAHNIRGPVARVKGLINLMFSTLSTEQLKPHLEKSVEDLDAVITDLTEILNIRNGIEKNAEQLHLREVLNNAIELVSDMIKGSNAVIDTSTFKDVSVKGVKVYFTSIFYNLLQNAMKYSSHDRRPIIYCVCEKIDNKITIEVADNGIGIDMRYAENKIFNLYQRFHTEVNGKGFGLFLVKTQVEAMNGTISVTSEPGKGTTFRMEFPYQD